jgi:nucleoside-diphosphate-sugar epimerase
MKVLVTGTDGYIGILLGPTLLEQGHDVVGLNTGFYRNDWLYNGVAKFMCISKDIRHTAEKDLEGFDAVVHLAELMCRQWPMTTFPQHFSETRRLMDLLPECDLISS